MEVTNMEERNKVTITEEYATVWKKNPISGHEWPERGKFKGWEVSGGVGFISTFCRTYKAALAIKEYREYMIKKHPFLMPRNRREIEYMNKHNIPIPEGTPITENLT